MSNGTAPYPHTLKAPTPKARVDIPCLVSNGGIADRHKVEHHTSELCVETRLEEKQNQVTVSNGTAPYPHTLKAPSETHCGGDGCSYHTRQKKTCACVERLTTCTLDSITRCGSRPPNKSPQTETGLNSNVKKRAR